MKHWPQLLCCLVLLCFPACTKPKADSEDTNSELAADNDSLKSNDSSSLSSKGPSAQALIRFEDVTNQSGVRHVVKSGSDKKLFTMVEFVGAGVGVIDFDLDGLHDLIFAAGGDFPSEKTMSGYRGACYRAYGRSNSQM